MIQHKAIAAMALLRKKAAANQSTLRQTSTGTAPAPTTPTTPPPGGTTPPAQTQPLARGTTPQASTMQQQGSPAVLNKYMPPSQQQPTDTNPEETKFNEIDKRLTDMERRTDLATRADKVRKDMYSRQEVQLDAIAQQRKVQQKKMDLINQARGVVGGQQMPS